MPVKLMVLLTVVALAACGGGDKKATTDGSACTPKTCQSEGKNCGSMLDGCGKAIPCGDCTAPESCGGGGVANVCGSGTCTPTSCAAEGKDCGKISDRCSEVLTCGECTLPKTCGGGGVANVCGATVDAGLHPDAPVSGLCSPQCMAQPGAVCCRECGCTGTVKCTPVCTVPDTVWDCELGKCH